MLTPAFIRELHCPYCGSALAVDRIMAAGRDGDSVEHGVLRCDCYRYPVLDGILVLKQQSGAADTADARVSYLLAGEIDRARYHAMHVDAPLRSSARGGALQRLVERASDNGVPLARGLARLYPKQPAGSTPTEGTRFADLLARQRPGLYSQYLYHRYANNSFLASISPLLLLGDLEPGERVLEIACGIGHSAHLIRTLFPHLQLVATDHDFVNLTIARQHFAPGALLVCVDAEAPLPFSSKSFGAVFCLDGFHYLRSKVALIKDLDRITSPHALWLFPHLHNASQENFNPGIPLDAPGYARCFGVVPHRLFSESSLLRDFHRDGTLRLDLEADPEQLARSPNLTAIGTRRPGFWRPRADLAPRLAVSPSTLIINPIYRVDHGAEVSHLTMSWPSARLRAECLEAEDYLPVSCKIDSRLLHRLRHKAMSQQDHQVVLDLVRRFVLVNLPPVAYADG